MVGTNSFGEKPLGRYLVTAAKRRKQTQGGHKKGRGLLRSNATPFGGGPPKKSSIRRGERVETRELLGVEETKTLGYEGEGTQWP